MGTCRRALLVAALLVITAPGPRGQSAAPLNQADAKSFLGVWVIEMTEPAALKGHTQYESGTTVELSPRAFKRTPTSPQSKQQASTEMATCWS
jgi:hypothetical protein